MTTYVTTVGLEIHAELKTKSKMFCGCKNDPHASEPNANICPVCLAHPGTLPSVNKEAVRCLMIMGTAIGGELAEYSEFDRKNYFYPDIPKAYQISQYQFPFVTGGSIADVAVTRVHLEEDTARSVHDQGDESLVDFNRAGVPLMELVTEPVIHTPQEAGQFARELQLLLRTLGISDANMEKGEMRVEANISVSSTDELGTKVEVKNLNSFKSVEAAIEYETQRHIELIERGEHVEQETRGWDENRSKTFLQRRKETAHDYRYFPDPDIPKFKRSDIGEFSNSRLKDILPETPNSKRLKLKNLGLESKQIEIIIAESDRDIFFSKLMRARNDLDLKLASNYFTSDILSIIASDSSSNLREANEITFGELLKMLQDDEITSRVAKDLLKEVVFEGKRPKELAQSRGLVQENSPEALNNLVLQIVKANPEVVAEYKAGKVSSAQYLLGQGMKLSKGSANPSLLLELIKKTIEN